MSDLNPVELLRRLVEIESVSGGEHHVASFLVTQMKAAGFEAFIDEAGNAVGIREGKPAEASRELMLLGHMDTVPGRIPVRVEGDLLYGRGSVDAKGPLAAFVSAAARAELAPGTRLVVIGAVEEEALSRGARFLADRWRPTACIIGEPSGWDAITLGYKGRLLADLHTERAAGHTAGPRGGVAETAVEWWTSIARLVESLNEGASGVFETIQCGLRSIRTSSDGLTESVDATVGFRLPPGRSPEQLARLLLDVSVDGQVTFRGHEHAFTSDRRTALAAPFVRAIRQAGASPRFKNKTGTSDMNVVGPAWECPIVAYGPGDSSLDHTPNEHISIPEYLRAIDVLGSVLNEFNAAGTVRLGGEHGIGTVLDYRLHTA